MMAERRTRPLMASNNPPPPGADTVQEARRLLRSARCATLATQMDGQPYAALVTPAVMPDGSVVLLLSGLSEHTRHLRVEPRCALLVQGEPATPPNPQTAPRLTVSGKAAPEHDPALKQRWLRMHPYAAMYAGLPDFTLWQIQPTGAHFIGGFARAGRVAAADLRPDPAVAAALARTEASILSHCNNDHGGALDAILRARVPGASPGWQMVAVDTDGFDLAREEVVHRVHWSAPVSDALQVRSELVRLAHQARTGPAEPSRARSSQVDPT